MYPWPGFLLIGRSEPNEGIKDEDDDETDAVDDDGKDCDGECVL